MRPKDWKKFEQNNKVIALNMLFIRHNTETIRVAYRSEYNSKYKKQVILLIVTLGKKTTLSFCNLLICIASRKITKSPRIFLFFKLL